MNKLALALLFIASSTVYADADLYKIDYEKFWAKWNVSLVKFEKCIDASMFLSSATQMLGNAEVSEANSEAIGKLSINNPGCMVSAMEQLNDTKLEAFHRSFIMGTLFHNSNILVSSLLEAATINTSKRIIKLLTDGRI